jgi:hypothetical protein
MGILEYRPMSSHNRLFGPSYLPAGTTENLRSCEMPTPLVGFMPCPTAVLAGWSEERLQELRRIYERAYEMALQSQVLSQSAIALLSIHGRN